MAKIATLALSALLPLAAWAQQTIVLRDGTQFNGRMTAASERTITFDDQQGQNHRFDVNEVESIRFDQRAGYDNGRAQNGNRSGFNGNGVNGNNDSRDTRGYNRNSSRHEMSLASGTEIGVRTNENINSQDAGQGRSYSAQVDRDVVDSSGNVVIPRGSDAQLVVRRLNDGNLSLDLQSVSVNGQRYTVDSADVVQEAGSREGIGKNKRTGEYVGGGAVLGTLLGAIAGGGKGAAIGALAGGAAGAGAQVLTRGNQVKVPAETVLNFRLDNQMRLNPVQ
jgi:hypothetical protein